MTFGGSGARRHEQIRYSNIRPTYRLHTDYIQITYCSRIVRILYVYSMQLVCKLYVSNMICMVSVCFLYVICTWYAIISYVVLCKITYIMFMLRRNYIQITYRLHTFTFVDYIHITFVDYIQFTHSAYTSVTKLSLRNIMNAFNLTIVSDSSYT